MLRRFILVAMIGGLSIASASAQAKKNPPKAAVKKEATPVEALQTLPNFKIELIETSDPAEEGSWINLAKDEQGRLIIGGQRGQGMLRLTLKDGKVAKKEKLALPFTECMGLLVANGSLYVNGAGPQGFGLYRCVEGKTENTFEDVRFLKAFNGAGEHGPHGVAQGPDGKIYVINGNHTELPEGLVATSPHKNYREDHLLPRQWDAGGHATGKVAPGGYVVRMDADGKNCELVLGGFRNAYDFAFNADGELFTFDSDMEWDWGMSWYRPTRVNHCVSGAEFGWRSGTGKWPEYYPDSLPPTVNIGVGSPTGVSNGIGAKFPEKYQKSMYILDWTYGRIMAVHLTPKGSSYTATFENFVAPKSLTDNSPKKPLNVTDAVIGVDGAMYFTVGGRNTQAALYRVSFTGTGSTAPVTGVSANSEQRKVRHDLEAFHGKVDSRAVAAAWPHLSSDDLFLRSAARIAIEAQPVAEWKTKAISEKQPIAALTALLALARVAPKETQPELLAALDAFPASKLDQEGLVLKLRVLALSFLRQNYPSLAVSKKLIAELDPLYPNPNEILNRELVQMLVYLQAPGVVAKTLPLMAKAKTQEDQMHYLFHLRTLPIGNWTIAERKEYLSYFKTDHRPTTHEPNLVTYFQQAGRAYGDGASYPKYLKNILNEAVQNFSEAERKELAPIVLAIDKAAVVTYATTTRKEVKKYTASDIASGLAKTDKGRSFERGRQAYIDAQCMKCHRVGNEGGAVGPDLTAIASRFSRKDIVESIMEPSKVISDQYQYEKILTLSGKTVIGRVVDENATTLTLQADPFVAERQIVKKNDIESREASKVSPMPEHLIDVLKEDEIWDLLAYLESGGNKKSSHYTK